MTRPRVLAGAVVASLLIGPIVATPLAIAGASAESDGALTAWWLLPVMLALAVPVGFVVAIVPNLVGSALLAWAGTGNIGLRLPPVWALAGAALGAGLAATIDDGATASSPVALVAGIGAVSALLCRWRINWA